MTRDVLLFMPRYKRRDVVFLGLECENAVEIRIW